MADRHKKERMRLLVQWHGPVRGWRVYRKRGPRLDYATPAYIAGVTIDDLDHALRTAWNMARIENKTDFVEIKINSIASDYING
jgi:hypothetical protein